jgi:hypothetical protein|tara:strand:+ start:972 stop:1094 length:123 start_codon:yes stop_codon:yes gene_type:complete
VSLEAFVECRNVSYREMKSAMNDDTAFYEVGASQDVMTDP